MSTAATLPLTEVPLPILLGPTAVPGPAQWTKPGGVAATVLAKHRYSELEVSVDADRALWCWMAQTGRPSFTPALLGDLARMQQEIRDAFRSPAASRPIDFLVFASRMPGTFSLGGDLELFGRCIAQRDAEGLRDYAYRCVEVVHANCSGYDNRVVTIALVQGDALGGGLESALSCDYVVVERQAKLGFPEVLFNLFPGMGAYSFLSRRIGRSMTEEMLRTGTIYTADELLALGAIDFVVDAGQGEAKVKELIAKTQSRFNAHSALLQVRRRVDPVTLSELKDIADLWVEAAMRLDETDLRRMSKITAAQDRALNRRVLHVEDGQFA